MNQLAEAAWIAFCIIWSVGAFTNKRDIRRMAWRPALLYGFMLAVGLNLLFNPMLRVGAMAVTILPDGTWIDESGAAVQVVGIAIAVWARVHIGRNWSGTISLKEGHALVRSGPYALVRHPIYTGLLLAILGKAIARGDLAALLGFLVLLFEWKRKSLIEERLMEEQFGWQYREFRKQVKALVPWVW